MTIYEMRKALGDTQSEFAERYDIPFRTIQNWESGVRKSPEYVTLLSWKAVYGLIYAIEKLILCRNMTSIKKNCQREAVLWVLLPGFRP